MVTEFLAMLKAMDIPKHRQIILIKVNYRISPMQEVIKIRKLETNHIYTSIETNHR